MRIDQPAAQRTSLRVHATAGELEAAFGVALDDYQDGAGHRWHEPARVAQIPAAIRADVAGLSGLSDRPRFSLVSEAGAPSSGYDAATLGRVYDFAGLWDRGLHGEGQGVAIISFAPYRPKRTSPSSTRISSRAACRRCSWSRSERARSPTRRTRSGSSSRRSTSR